METKPTTVDCEAEGVTASPVVDAAWVTEHLGEDGLLLADVRGPNAHIRGHLPGSIPLVLGSPAPVTDRAVLEELASEVGLRLRRHGVTGEERLVLYDGGDCIGACSSYQLAALAGHPSVAVMAGGLKSWQGELEQGVAELEKNRNELDPRFEAVPTLEELAGRLDDPELTILDVRREDEFTGKGGYPCDPRQGHIPGARNIEAGDLFACAGRAAARRRRSASWSDCPRARRSSPTATRARARPSPRWRSARPATAPGTTPARGTSGRATTSFRSSASSGAADPRVCP